MEFLNHPRDELHEARVPWALLTCHLGWSGPYDKLPLLWGGTLWKDKAMATVRAGRWLWVPAGRSSDITGGKRDGWTLGFVQRPFGYYLGRSDQQNIVVTRAVCLLRKALLRLRV